MKFFYKLYIKRLFKRIRFAISIENVPDIERKKMFEALELMEGQALSMLNKGFLVVIDHPENINVNDVGIVFKTKDIDLSKCSMRQLKIIETMKKSKLFEDIKMWGWEFVIFHPRCIVGETKEGILYKKV